MHHEEYKRADQGDVGDALIEKNAPDLRQGHSWRHACVFPFPDPTSRRLVDSQQQKGEQHPRRACVEEHHLPRFHLPHDGEGHGAYRGRQVRQRTADDEGEAVADIDAHREEAQGDRQSVPRKVVGQHRLSGRAEGALSPADSRAR